MASLDVEAVGPAGGEHDEHKRRQQVSPGAAEAQEQLHAAERVVKEDAQAGDGDQRGQEGIPEALVAAGAAEEHEDGDASDGLRQDEADRAHAGHAGVQHVVRVQAHHREEADADHGTDGLHDRGDVGGLRLASGVAERRPDQMLAAQGVQVAGDVVVDGHHGREDRRDDEDIEEDGAPAAQDHVADPEHQVARLLGGDLHGVIGAQGADDQPGDAAVDGGHEEHRKVGGAGNGAFRVAGFLAVDRAALDAAEGDAGEHQGHAQAGAEQRRRCEGRQAERGFGWAVQQHAAGQDEQQQAFEAHQEAQHPRAGMHATDAEVQAGGRRHRCAQPPGHGHAGGLEDQLGRIEAKAAIEADLDRRIGKDGQGRRAQAGQLAHAQGHVGIERTGIADMPGHGHVAHGEQHQDRRSKNEGRRRTDAAADAEHDRHDGDHAGQRRGRRDDEAGDGRNAEGVAFQTVVATAAERWGIGGAHLGLLGMIHRFSFL